MEYILQRLNEKSKQLSIKAIANYTERNMKT